MRVVVVGVSGSGKTTFGQRLAAATGIPHTELDVVNWGPGWYDRHKHETDAFIATVDAASRGESWVISGGYLSTVGDLLWARATDLVWLDLPRLLVMRQVIRRSVWRAASRKDVFEGCKEDWLRMLTKDHPIRFAWDTHARRRAQITERVARPTFAHLTVHRCLSRQDVAAAFERLSNRGAAAASAA